MGHMKKDTKRIVICAFLLVLMSTLIIGISVYFNRKFSGNEKVLDGDWNVTINDTEYTGVTLSQFKLPKLERGDKLVLTRVLETTGFEQTVLRVQSRYSSVKVYLNGVYLYEYGQEYLEKGLLIGNGYHWISMPDNYNHKILRIEYGIGEDEAFTYIDEIELMNSLQVYSSLLSRNLVTAIIACCLLAIGLISIVAAVYMTIKDNRMYMLLWLGFFAYFVSSWMICNSRLIEGMSQNLRLICHIEYLSMYLASINMILFVSVFFKSPQKKKLFRGMGLFFILMCTVLTILNVTNIIHFPKSVIFFQVVALISTVIIIFNLAYESARQKMAERTFLIGVVCFFVSVMLELIRYRYNKICIPENVISISVIPIGTMIFILSMFAGFFIRIMEKIAENMERKTLYNMAYKDALTGIKNRAWCEKVMDEYETGKKPVTIINMDLNLFKEVNDTYGHAAGDELLVKFAKILKDVFDGENCVGRMGGDEFVVIAPHMKDEVVEEYIAKLKDKIESDNKEEKKAYKISVAFGYASDPTGDTSTPWKVYEAADAKMYKYKKSEKEHRK